MVASPASSEWADVVFYVNTDLPTEHERNEIIKSLLSRGAKQCPPSPPARGNRFDVDAVTIVISHTSNFPEYDEIMEWNKKMIKLGNGEERKERKWVVTTEWLTRMEKCAKWQNPRYFSVEPRMYFSGVCICVSDELSTGDRDAISAAVQAFGGQFKTVLTTEVTHLLCSEPKGPMYTTGIQHVSQSFHVVLPHWFDKCVAAGMLVDLHPFEWPNPPLLATNGNPAALLATNVPQPIKSILANNVRSEQDAALHPNYTTNEVLKGKRIVFSRTPRMDPSRLEGIKAMVARSGGEVLEGGREEKLIGDEGEGDVLITQYRSGKAFCAAVRARKTIATVAWLYHVCMADQWSDPKDHLLHFPVPETSIPEFEKYQMTVTNYTGDTREYIKRLIDLMGGQFTADMGKENTHVIAASDLGKKAAKARSKDKVLVTHFWVEACFVKWAVVSPTSENRYAVDAHGLSAQSLVAKRGLLDADLQPWTDLAWDEAEEEEDEAMEVEEDLIPSKEDGIILTGASGRDRGDVEMALEEGSEEADEDEDLQVKPPVRDTNGKAVEEGAQRKKLSASQSKSSSSIVPPSKLADKAKAPLRASQSTSATTNVKSPAKLAKSTPSSTTMAAGPSSPRRLVPAINRHEPSSTPQSDDDDDDIPPPIPAARSKPASTNAHASSSKPISTVKKTSTAVASPAKSVKAAAPSTPRDSSAQPRGLSPSSIVPRSRRKAAGDAEQKLHAAMEDRNAYEKDKRAGRLMSDPSRRRKSAGGDGGAGSSSPVRAEKKRKVEQDDDESEDEEAAVPTPKGKGAAGKAKEEPVETIAWLMTTKLNKELTQKDFTALESLGAKITTQSKRCTHLISPEVSRTEKFLNALSVGAVILNEKWISASIKAGKLLDAEAPYLLVDPKNEKKFGISLPEVIKRAARNKERGGLFKGKSFWWAKGVVGQPEVIRVLVQAAGGSFTEGIPKTSVLLDSPEDAFLICSPDERATWKPLKDKGVKVYDRELILSGMIQQKLEPSKHLLK